MRWIALGAFVWLVLMFGIVVWFRSVMRHAAPPDDFGWLPAPIVLGCLDCRGDLEPYEHWYRCERCRILYVPELLAETPAEVWYRIQEGRMICYECDSALPDMPRVHVSADGQPIPCPVHGPAPEVPR